MTWNEFRKELKALGIVTKETGIPYVILPSMENVRWIFPLTDRKNWEAGLKLYEPGTFKGKLYKLFLKMTPLWGIKIWKKDFIILVSWDNEEIITGRNIPAFFTGNGGPDSKATIQQQMNGRVLSYLKFTESKRIYGLFRHEQEVLQELGKEFEGLIPKLQHCGPYHGMYLFEASSVKSGREKIAFQFQNMHKNFLVRLLKKTESQKDACRIYEVFLLDRLVRMGQAGLKLEGTDILLKKSLEKLKQEHMPFCRIHGDFTPWNTIIEQKQLKVFDWEYSREDRPAFLDAFHFILQPRFLKKEQKARLLIKRLERDRVLKAYLKETGYKGSSYREMLTIYLIEQLSFYSLRTNGPDGQDVKMLFRWQNTLRETKNMEN